MLNKSVSAFETMGHQHDVPPTSFLSLQFNNPLLGNSTHKFFSTSNNNNNNTSTNNATNNFGNPFLNKINPLSNANGVTPSKLGFNLKKPAATVPTANEDA